MSFSTVRGFRPCSKRTTLNCSAIGGVMSAGPSDSGKSLRSVLTANSYCWIVVPRRLFAFMWRTASSIASSHAMKAIFVA